MDFKPSKVLLIALAAVSVAGCANTSDPKAVKSATVETMDKYTKLTSVTADLVQVGKFPDLMSYQLQGSIDQDPSIKFIRLYFNYFSQSGWRFFETATDINGNELQLTKVDQVVEYGGNTTEAFALELSRDYLVSHQEHGINVRLGGRGVEILQVPGPYVTGFLAKYDEVVQKKSTGQVARTSEEAVTAPHTLGINTMEIPSKIVEPLHLRPHQGLMIMRVTAGSPAAIAGIKIGDIILEWNGIPINGDNDMKAASASAPSHGSLLIQRGLDQFTKIYDMEP